MKALLFDLDGTLIDSAPDLMVALNKLLLEEGRQAVDISAVRNMIGDGVPKLVARGFEFTGTPLTDDRLKGLVPRYLELYEPHCADLTTVYPGVFDALESLKATGDYLFGCCTNKPQIPSVEILEKLGLTSYFKAVLGGDACPVKKPHPGHLLATLEALGAPVEGAVLIGDSPNDAEAAQAAGLACVLVTFGYTRIPVEQLPATALIDHFDQLPGVIASLA